MSDVESDPVEFLAGDLPSPEVEMATLGANVGSAADLAIEDINPANPHLFKNDCWQDHFARLRAEDPVHLNEPESSGRYWSLTKYDDVRATDGTGRRSPRRVASAWGSVRARRPTSFWNGCRPSSPWIRRSTPSSARPCEACRRPSNLRNLEPMIRERTAQRPGLAARRRDVRLGRHRVDRADHADAGDAVRLPDGGPAQAHPLVRHRLRHARAGRHRREPAAEVRGARRVPAYFEGLWDQRVASTGRTSSRCSPTARPPRTWPRWITWGTCCC